MKRLLSSLSIVVASVVLHTAEVGAQQGAIVGRVLDKSGGGPITDASVLIVNTQRGARTGEDGRYRIAGIQPGTYQVRVNRIGYGAMTQSATVSSGDVTVDFRLEPTAVTIDEVVVSATGTSERKRESGSDVGIIKPTNEVLASTQNFTQVLAARTPGLIASSASGSVGTSARIRIRGANSISLSNDPLLIVDGVRVDNNTNANSSLGVGGQTINRFDDINQEDIESVEVLKGPAASALYGTAASNGVIQVTTKRGRSGKTSWKAFASGGQLQDATNYPDNFYRIGTDTAGIARYTSSCTTNRAAARLCIQTDTVLRFNPIKAFNVFQKGPTSSGGLSAAGGSDLVQYFISGDVNKQQGVVQSNSDRTSSGRANLNMQLRPDLNVGLTSNYVDRRISLPFNDNNIYGAVPNGVLGKAADCRPGVSGVALAVCKTDTLSRGFYSVPPSTFYYRQNEQLVKRFVGGLNATYQPLEWLTAVGQAGLDVNNLLENTLTPANVITYINQTLIDGSRSQDRLQNMNYSLNGSVTAGRSLTNTLKSQTVVGGQYLNEQQHFTLASGRNLVPGTGSLATAGAGFSVNEGNQTIITVGGYLREQLAWRDRLFVTMAVRADENSAFGENFSLAKYPSVSASWVASEEDFFRTLPVLGGSWLNQLRLRTSYGVSGQKPGFRQADTYLSGVAVADKSSSELTAVIIGGTGNPNLRPERSKEYEVGFDASFLENRVGLTYTFYNKRTVDQLVARTLAPSLGVANTQYFNLGEGLNRGHEVSLNITALDLPSTKLELLVSGTTLQNKLLTLSNNPDVVVPAIYFNGGLQRFQEGFSSGAFFQPKIVSVQDKNGDGKIGTTGCAADLAHGFSSAGTNCEVILGDTTGKASYIGPVLPTREFSFVPSATFFNRVRLTANFNYRGGHYVYNNTEEFRCTSSAFFNCQAINDKNASPDDYNAAIAKLAGNTSSVGYIQKGDFTKLREVSATVTLPEKWAAKARARSMSVTLAGRNLATWTKYKGFDPEVNASTASFTQFDFLTQPPLRMWTTRFDIAF
jgi:TonB-dependent starch-binding outer membrane protein SusC